MVVITMHVYLHMFVTVVVIVIHNIRCISGRYENEQELSMMLRVGSILHNR